MLPKGAACAGRWASPPRASSPSTQQRGPPNLVSGNLGRNKLSLISSCKLCRMSPRPCSEPAEVGKVAARWFWRSSNFGVVCKCKMTYKHQWGYYGVVAQRSWAFTAQAKVCSCVCKLAGQPWDLQPRAAECRLVGMQLLQVAASGCHLFFRTATCLCFTSLRVSLKLPLLHIFITSTG